MLIRGGQWGTGAGAKTIELGGGLRLYMVWIPPGSFIMGAAPAPTDMRHDTADWLDEYLRNDPLVTPVAHQVTLTHGFWLGKYEVTQDQFLKVAGYNPASYEKLSSWRDLFSCFGEDPPLPVDCVSWDYCQEFVTNLNAMTGGHFRLPTEAEWEYACRAGTQTAFSFGDSEKQAYKYGWFSTVFMHPVGRKKPNALGLYDMHGNVYEWCQDWWGDYPNEPVTDPTGPESGTAHVMRGGSSAEYPILCTSAIRMYGPSKRIKPPYGRVGFRVASD